MPTYKFHNKDTGEVWEEFMGISAADDILKDNPHIEKMVGLHLEACCYRRCASQWCGVSLEALVIGLNRMVGSRKSYQKYQRQIQPLPLRTLTERRMQNPLR